MVTWIASVSLVFGTLGSSLTQTAPQPPAASGSPAAAAQEPEEIRVDFQMDVLLVEFDVSVHDRRGDFIAGLTREQFRLLEDGREVPIADFEELVQKADPQASPGAEEARGRNFLIFVDTYLASMRKVAQIRRDLVRFLEESLAPGDSLSLAVLDGFGSLEVHPGVELTEAVRIAQDISLPLARLTTPTTNSYEDARHVLAQVEESVTAVLGSDVPPPRSLIFLSPGFVPAEPEAPLSAEDIGEMIRGFAPIGIAPPSGRFDPFNPEETRRFRGSIQRADRPERPENRPSIEALVNSLAGWLSARHITLYSINCGDRGPLDLFTDNSLGSSPARSAFTGGLSIMEGMKLNMLEDLAELTGGLAWLNTRSYRRAFHNIDEATASVYRISFRPDTNRPRGRYHKIEVEVSFPKKVKVRHPRGYLDS